MRRLVPLLAAFAVLLSLAAPPGPALAAGQKSAGKNPASTSVQQVFRQRNARTLAILEADFPRDHDALMAVIADLRDRPDSLDTKLSVLFSELTRIRRKYADRMRFAPVPEQRALIGALGEFMERVAADAGPEICGRFAQDGSGALFERGLSARFAPLIDQQSAAYFEAVVAAIENPEVHGPIAQEDWAEVFRQMVENGHPQSYVATIARGAAEDPALCPALSAMLGAAARMEAPSAVRFRADFANSITGY